MTAPEIMQTASAPETAAPHTRSFRYSQIDHCQGARTSEVGFSDSLSSIPQEPLLCVSDSALMTDPSAHP